MKKPHHMNMDELLSLPVIKAKDILDSAEAFGGCFRDHKGMLWGTCLFAKVWARYQATQFAARAGVSEMALSQFGVLRGFIDFCDGVRVAGWVQDPAAPDAPVRIDVMVDGKFAARTIADQFRSDLENAGIGNGRHAFDVKLRPPLSRDVAHLVVVQRASDAVFLDVALVAAQQSVA